MSLTAKHIANVMKEAYEVAYLPERENAKYWLICKYEKKVSQRLLTERRLLRKRGAELFIEVWRKALSPPSIFDFIRKKNQENSDETS